MQSRKFIVPVLIVFLFSLGCTAMKVAFANVPRMANKDLVSKMENMGVVIIDVRTTKYWEESTYKIRGAVREDPDDPGSWAHKYANDETIVLYCS